MALVFEQINSEGLAQLSYIVGDDKAGVAAVIDPRRDVEIYVEKASSLGVRITHAIETHIHADFVSGTLELAAQTGAKICGGASEDYKFELEQLKEGDEIVLGNVTLRAVHTPGHTPEHISLLAFDKKQGEEPFAIFTGDTLFNLDVGRPDLLGKGTETDLAKKLYHSLFEKILPLGRPRRSLPVSRRGLGVRQIHRRPPADDDRQRARFQRNVQRKKRKGVRRMGDERYARTADALPETQKDQRQRRGYKRQSAAS